MLTEEQREIKSKENQMVFALPQYWTNALYHLSFRYYTFFLSISSLCRGRAESVHSYSFYSFDGIGDVYWSF